MTSTTISEPSKGPKHYNGVLGCYKTFQWCLQCLLITSYISVAIYDVQIEPQKAAQTSL